MTVESHGRLYLPALRGNMGDWAYYLALVKFQDLALRVSLAQDIHKAHSLNQLIQRQVTQRAGQISEYLLSQEQRFFNSLVIAVYGGMPEWYELSVRANDEVKIGELSEDLQASLGVLVLSGEENLFALDGQHRLVGIKEALQQNARLGDEEVGVIFVGHKRDDAGMTRTRRLFTTLNRYAKPVSELEKIGMDEDDIIAIVTRRVANEVSIFHDAIAESKGKAIRVTDRKNITTLKSLYDALNTFLQDRDDRKWDAYKRFRPTETAIDSAFRKASRLFDVLAMHFEPLGRIKTGEPSSLVVPEYRDRETGGHLILRPIGIEAVVATICELTEQGVSLREATRRVARVPMILSKAPWAGLLWDTSNRLITGYERNLRVARWVLLHGAGGDLTALNKVTLERAERELTGILNPDTPDAPLVKLERYAQPIGSRSK